MADPEPELLLESSSQKMQQHEELQACGKRGDFCMNLGMKADEYSYSSVDAG